MATAFLTSIEDPRFNGTAIEVLLSVSLYDDADAVVDDANTSVQFARTAAPKEIQRAIIAAIIVRAGQCGIVVQESDVLLLRCVERG